MAASTPMFRRPPGRARTRALLGSALTSVEGLRKHLPASSPSSRDRRRPLMASRSASSSCASLRRWLAFSAFRASEMLEPFFGLSFSQSS